MSAEILAIGEILIDLTQSGMNEQGIPRFDANPGGAPANLAVAASRLGAKTAFIGRVGRDGFGASLKKTLEDNGVDTTCLVADPDQHTTLAVVTVDPTGERAFSFYRDPSADVNLSPEDVSEELLAGAKILHFGSVSLTASPSRETTLGTARRAKKLGLLVSYDPNYREALWKDKDYAIVSMLAPMAYADILKVSDEELLLLTGTSDCDAGTRMLAEKYKISLVCVTLGPDGVYYRRGEETGRVPGFACVVGDTNGAGDTFFGAFLSQLVQQPELLSVSTSELERMLSFANLAASITTSRRGAIPAMPTLEEMKARLS